MTTASTTAAGTKDWTVAGTYDTIQVTPVTPTIGAEVTGVSLANVDDQVFEEIHDAFLRHKVLFFRDQADFTAVHLEQLAGRFGEVDVPPKALPLSETPGVAVIETNSSKRPYVDYWHTDLAYKRRPALVSILCGRVIPPVGGDTLWVDMEAAYEDLSDEVKERLNGLRTYNSYEKSLRGYNEYAARDGRELLSEEVIAQRLVEHPPVEHPLVRTHPVTGRKSIYMSINATTHLVGLDPAESDELLDFLYRLSDKPEHQVRLRWAANTVAMWDNRSTRHYATADYFPQRRVMERAIVIGEEPA
ncbi:MULTISPECIES: TauD/TfdA dioxygenase family protein [unclassified Streptomyces]|uniref:TauD/TfdA dioxygenase family protein n=1 Tax=unclassified Streptomyces TaxID=2593676 RepID=UPI003D8D281D